MKYISQGAGKRESKQTTADQKKKNQENAEQTNTLCHRSWFCFNSLFYSVFPVFYVNQKEAYDKHVDEQTILSESLIFHGRRCG